MFAKLLALLALVATTTAFHPEFETVLESGEKVPLWSPENWYVEKKFRFTIPDGQCTGHADITKACHLGGYVKNINNLKAKLTDGSPYPAIVFKNAWQTMGVVQVYRKGLCEGSIILELSATCKSIAAVRPYDSPVNPDGDDHVNHVDHEHEEHGHHHEADQDAHHHEHDHQHEHDEHHHQVRDEDRSIQVEDIDVIPPLYSARRRACGSCSGPQALG